MTLLIILIVGGLIGWVAGMIMGGRGGIIMNVVVGIIGALIAGFVINPLIGGDNIMSGDLSWSAIGVSLLGAVILLAIINMFRRGSAR